MSPIHDKKNSKLYSKAKKKKKRGNLRNILVIKRAGEDVPYSKKG